jgi:hypothetical protein
VDRWHEKRQPIRGVLRRALERALTGVMTAERNRAYSQSYSWWKFAYIWVSIHISRSASICNQSFGVLHFTRIGIGVRLVYLAHITLPIISSDSSCQPKPIEILHGRKLMRQNKFFSSTLHACSPLCVRLSQSDAPNMSRTRREPEVQHTSNEVHRNNFSVTKLVKLNIYHIDWIFEPFIICTKNLLMIVRCRNVGLDRGTIDVLVQSFK